MSLDAHAAVTWWRELQPTDTRPGDRATLARLRRCTLVSQAILDPATIDLFRRCGGTSHRDLPAVGLVAAVLAHVREDNPERIARRIGVDDYAQSNLAMMKPMRFRRLMEAETYDERLAAFRRLAAIAGGELNVLDLARALFGWTDELRQRWVYDYWTPPAAEMNSNKETTS